MPLRSAGLAALGALPVIAMTLIRLVCGRPLREPEPFDVPDTASPDFPHYLQWLHYAEGMIMPQVNVIMVETVFLPPERRSEQHAKRALKLMGRVLQAVDAHIEGRDYLVAGFTAADTITGHACMMCERLGVDLSPMPNVETYINRLKARPALQSALAL